MSFVYLASMIVVVLFASKSLNMRQQNEGGADVDSWCGGDKNSITV